ncbi:MAG: CBS domain-containing protein [Candidatus Lokiarchaeota archaeon]|nr:CBS domain-containing protein [Candidatus Lokiarchaeota archaeon]
MKIKDLNIYDEYATVKDESVFEAVKLMKQKKVPDLVLLGEDGKPKGIISSEDIVFKIIAEEKDAKVVKISEIARDVKTFTIEATKEEVFNYMMESDNEIVPIIKKDGKLLGVCTIADVAWEEEDK